MEDQLDEFVRDFNKCVTEFTRRTPPPMVKLAEQADLTIPQAAFLIFLHDTDESSVSSISRQWNISQSVATRTIDRLVEKNMVERERDNDDRRVVHTRLTGEGKKFVKRVCAQRDKNTREIFSVLNEKERTMVLEILKKINEGFE